MLLDLLYGPIRSHTRGVDTTFLVTSLVIIATPGTGAVFTLVAALAHGLRGGLLAALANATCLVPHVVAVVTGLASLLHASATAFSVVKYLGVGYLLYLAIMTWRGAGSLALDPGNAGPTEGLAVFRDATVLNLFNPKLTIFFVAFLPQFVHPSGGDVVVQMLILSGWFALLTFTVYAVYAIAAARLRDVVLARPGVTRRVEKGFAVTFAVLAARLATAGR